MISRQSSGSNSALDSDEGGRAPPPANSTPKGSVRLAGTGRDDWVRVWASNGTAKTPPVAEVNADTSWAGGGGTLHSLSTAKTCSLTCALACCLSQPPTSNASYSVSACRTCATTARRTACSSRSFAAALRPTRPLYLRQACSAICVSRPCGQPRIEFPDSFGKPNDVLVIQLGPALSGAGAPRLPGRGVRRALLLCLLEGVLLDQQPLAFVSLARPTPFQDHRREPGVLAGATRQGRVTGGEEDEVVQVGAGEAQGPSPRPRA